MKIDTGHARTRGQVDLFWKDSIQAHDTATERATTARMLPLDLLRAWPF